MTRLLKTRILFGVSYGVEAIKNQELGDMVKYQKHKRAMDLGLMIGEKKYWDIIRLPELENRIQGQLEVYVFTKPELKEYIERVINNTPYIWDEETPDYDEIKEDVSKNMAALFNIDPPKV